MDKLKNTSKESNNLKTEMLLRDRRAQQLQKTLEQYKEELSDYESQCDTLTQTLERVQRDLAQSESEKASLLREVSTSRALSSTLDNAKYQLQKRITVENERLQSAIKSLQTEKDLVLNQLKTEKSRADRLEKVVHTNQIQKSSRQHVMKHN
ncbi:hypothetical protein C1645_438699 [Glomus cerebriforme]|uniref:Uncharacterized protein n=1 Tax=Glomus cerebriforme TaxID=658196 RepID=A0A397TC90_9GLOM|nr:hypothetical protein C1645_438699 [Glomus cerebriforme]